MLTIEPPIYQIRSTTIFRDHADLDQFYALPESPQLVPAATGQPAFTLYKYRRDLTDNPALDPTRGRGAGMALFEVEAPLIQAGRLQAELAAVTGRPDARLGPVAFHTATAHAIVAHGQMEDGRGDSFAEDLVDTIPVSPVTPHRAAFALALTSEGATLMEQAARGDALPIGVAYEMVFLALSPALHARVRMDYERIYDHFSAGVSFTYYVSAKLDLDLIWLVQHDLVHIEITAFADDADAKRQRELVMQLVAARIQQDFFRSGIPPQPPAPGAGGALAQLLGSALGESSISSASALFVLKARAEVVRERKSFDLVYDGRTAVELTHVATGLLAGMLGAAAAAPAIHAIDLDDAFFSALSVQLHATADFAAMPDLREMVVQVAFGAHRKAFSFSAAAAGPYRFEAALTAPTGDAYDYTVEYHFDTDAGVGEALVAVPPRRTHKRVLVVDPLVDFHYRRVRVALAAAELPGVARILVTLRLRDDLAERDLARTHFSLDRDHAAAVWRIHLPLAQAGARVLASAAWQDAQGVLHPGAETTVADNSYLAFGPFAGLLSVLVQPAADWTKVTQVLAELAYRDGDDYLVARRLSFTAGAASQLLEIPLRNVMQRRYRWRQTVLYLDGTTAEVEWQEADRSILIIGQTAALSRDVRIIWVGAAGDALGLRVDFRVAKAAGEDEVVGVFLRAGADAEKLVTLPLDGDGRLAYRFEVKRLTAEGETPVRSGTGQGNLLVVQATG